MRQRSDSVLAGAFWVAAFSVWVLLIVAFLPGAIATAREPGVSTTESWAVVGIGLASSVIWFGGIRHLSMWVVSRLPRRPVHLRRRPGPHRVALVYCTADDFNPEALRTSMAQDHAVTTVIFDDSSHVDEREEIDRFAHDRGITVIRRGRRTGFKAGNLNHGLAQIVDEYDYLVILDSDERLPAHFVSRALDDFGADPRIGIVQGLHRALSNGTFFSRLFAGALESQVRVAQGARSRVGLSAFMGRGAMISAECIRRAGPFPEVVTEDVAMTLEARIAGFEVYFDRDLVSQEDYPVDYHAFRTQHAKTIEGTTEFVAGAWRRVLRSPMRATEKLDLLVEQTLAPAIGLSGIVLLVSGIVIAALGGEATQPLWAVFVTAVFGVAALLPETLRLARTRGPITAVRFLLGGSALYGSTFLITLDATLRVLLGKRATFVVTPKRVLDGSWRSVVFSLRLELVAALIVITVAILLSGSVGPAFPVLGPVLAAVFFATIGVWRERHRPMARAVVRTKDEVLAE